ncbi:MAG: energy-coupling factor transporter transmembrane protein EcfT, partial [Halanaerobiales bacterium]
MFLEYFPGETIIHRLDVRAKLFIFTVFLILLFLYRNPVYNLVFALLSTLFIYHIGLPFGKIFKILKPIFPILII